jgi:hypothetical protein
MKVFLTFQICKGLPNVFGKALCGNDFYFKLDDYGINLKTGFDKKDVILLDADDSRFNISNGTDALNFNKSNC